jgi:hypothetical protein
LQVVVAGEPTTVVVVVLVDIEPILVLAAAAHLPNRLCPYLLQLIIQW